MKKYQRFAPLGLYLAILAALVSAGMYFVRREFDLSLLSFGGGSSGIVKLAKYVSLIPKHVRSQQKCGELLDTSKALAVRTEHLPCLQHLLQSCVADWGRYINVAYSWKSLKRL